MKQIVGQMTQPVKNDPPAAATCWLQAATQAGLLAPGTCFGVVVPTEKGRRRVEQVLALARDIMRQQGSSQISLRNLARAAGMGLANLQHYFPTHADLLNAVFISVADSYDARYRDLLGRGFSSPRLKLETFLRFHVDDCMQPGTAALFFEIWSLAARDAVLGATMDSMYAWHRNEIKMMLAQACPGLSPGELSLRATLIVAQIEGLAVVFCRAPPEAAEADSVREACVDRLLDLALSPPSNGRRPEMQKALKGKNSGGRVHQELLTK